MFFLLLLQSLAKNAKLVKEPPTTAECTVCTIKLLENITSTYHKRKYLFECHSLNVRHQNQDQG